VEANIYGFPLEDSSKKFNLVGMSGLIKSINNNSIQYDIDTTMGQSGSPIMIEYASHEHIAIGIHTGKDDADAYNSGCLITN
jgi:V8-like Glu-specific endopeptidase